MTAEAGSKAAVSLAAEAHTDVVQSWVAEVAVEPVGTRAAVDGKQWAVAED